MSAPIETRVSAYVSGLLAGQLRDVAAAGRGGRDRQLLAAAENLGALLLLGLAVMAEEDALRAAGLAAGQSPAEVASTMRSGLARGRAKGRAALPRQLQELLEELDLAGLRSSRYGAAPVRPPAPLPAPPPEPELPAPPAAQVMALWGRALSVCDDVEVAAELRGRGLDPAAVADADLARALPPAPWPRWAWGPGGSWYDTGRRLLLPLYDAAGALRSVHARTLRQDLPRGFSKGLSPCRYSVKGLVLADATGQALLAGPPPPSWSGEAWIVEGCTDFLTAGTHHGDGADERPAVFGYLQGSWSADHAARVPAVARVLMVPHVDKDGLKMAARIASTLAPRAVRFVQTAEVADGR